MSTNFKKGAASKASSAPKKAEAAQTVKAPVNDRLAALEALDELEVNEAVSVDNSTGVEAIWRPELGAKKPNMVSETDKEGNDRYRYVSEMIRGIVVGVIPSFGALEKPMVIVERIYEGDSFKIGINCNTVLAVMEGDTIISGKLKNIEIGDVIQVTYVGDVQAKDAKKGANAYKNYEVVKWS
jgi:hypothetical protein